MCLFSTYLFVAGRIYILWLHIDTNPHTPLTAEYKQRQITYVCFTCRLTIVPNILVYAGVVSVHFPFFRSLSLRVVLFIFMLFSVNFFLTFFFPFYVSHFVHSSFFLFLFIIENSIFSLTDEAVVTFKYLRLSVPPYQFLGCPPGCYRLRRWYVWLHAVGSSLTTCSGQPGAFDYS